MTEQVRKIKVAVLKADSKIIEVIEDFDASYKSTQKVVGGRFEAITLKSYEGFSEITLWLNEEGKLIPLQPNFAILRKEDSELLDIIMGDVLFTSCNSEGETDGLTDEQIDFIKGQFDMDRGIILPSVFVEKSYFI